MYQVSKQQASRRRYRRLPNRCYGSYGHREKLMSMSALELLNALKNNVQQLALEERLASQGRTGLRTAMFGGSPEQFALAQAQEEAKARASLGALQTSTSRAVATDGYLLKVMFGLGGRAAALPQSLQLGQLQNIGLAQAAQAQPEQQLLAALTPAISVADLARTGQQYGAGLMAQAEAAGLENLLQTEAARLNALQNIYGNILGSAAAQRQQPQASLVSDVSGLFSALRDLF